VEKQAMQNRFPQVWLSPLVAAALLILMWVAFATGYEPRPLGTRVHAASERALPPASEPTVHASEVATETVYPFLEYDEPRSLHTLDQPSFFNEFFGEGTFDGCCSGASELITSRDDTIFVGEHGASLQLAYTLVMTMEPFGTVAYAQSAFGAPLQDRFALNLDDIFGELTDAPVDLERFEFYVRGSGATTNTHRPAAI
jgi:hypothetical protein